MEHPEVNRKHTYYIIDCLYNAYLSIQKGMQMRARERRKELRIQDMGYYTYMTHPLISWIPAIDFDDTVL